MHYLLFILEFYTELSGQCGINSMKLLRLKILSQRSNAGFFKVDLRYLGSYEPFRGMNASKKNCTLIHSYLLSYQTLPEYIQDFHVLNRE